MVLKRFSIKKISIKIDAAYSIDFQPKKAKSEYQEKLAAYYRSSQYQNYLQQKTRWDQAEVRDDDDMHFSMEPVDDVTVSFIFPVITVRPAN